MMVRLEPQLRFARVQMSLMLDGKTTSTALFALISPYQIYLQTRMCSAYERLHLATLKLYRKTDFSALSMLKC